MRIGRFRDCKRGNFAAMFALALPLILAGAAFAIDIANLVTTRHHLQNAVDSAVLAASRIRDGGADRQQVFQDFLNANLAARIDPARVTSELIVERTPTMIRTRGMATAEVDLSLMRYFGLSRYVSTEAGAFEATNKVEVALVLDNTGSMGVARMAALRRAATALIDILEAAATPDREIRAALVPFTTMVNVKGPGFKDSWIDREARAPYHGANFEPLDDGSPINHLDLFDALDVDWKGCVEARPAPYHLSDAAPDDAEPATLFVPYFAPDEPGNARQALNSATQFNNSYLDDVVHGNHRTRQRSTVKYAPSTNRYISEPGPLTTGPNYACPTPIHPLTTDLDALRTAISGMIHWYGSGTNVAEGLAWGMRVLSPGEPYNEGNSFSNDRVAKFAVVFTDGENQVFGASNAPINKSDYGAYGHLDQGRMGTTHRPTALAQVNQWTLDACKALKDEGVEIFTVLLGADTPANRALYSRCASRPENYFPTDDVSELESIFRTIGASLTRLYVTH